MESYPFIPLITAIFIYFVVCVPTHIFLKKKNVGYWWAVVIIAFEVVIINAIVHISKYLIGYRIDFLINLVIFQAMITSVIFFFYPILLRKRAKAQVNCLVAVFLLFILAALNWTYFFHLMFKGIRNFF